MTTPERLALAVCHFIVGAALGLSIAAACIGYWIGAIQ